MASKADMSAASAELYRAMVQISLDETQATTRPLTDTTAQVLDPFVQTLCSKRSYY